MTTLTKDNIEEFKEYIKSNDILNHSEIENIKKLLEHHIKAEVTYAGIVVRVYNLMNVAVNQIDEGFKSLPILKKYLELPEIENLSNLVGDYGNDEKIGDYYKKSKIKDIIRKNRVKYDELISNFQKLSGEAFI